MDKDCSLVFPQTDFNTAFAQLCGLQKDAFKNFSVPQMILEMILNWKNCGQVVLGMAQPAYKRRVHSLDNIVLTAAPIKALPGRKWFVKRLEAKLMTELLARYSKRTRTIPSSRGEQDLAIADQLNFEEESTHYSSRGFPISRLIPERVSELFDTDHYLANSISMALLKRPSMLNLQLLE